MCKKLIYLFSFVLVLGMVLTSVAKADLVGWWRFNEGSGDTASDSSGNGHDGTLNGNPEWAIGPPGFGGAIAFHPDKCTGIDCGIFDPTNGTGQFTVALWAFWDGTGTYQHFITKSAAWGADTMMFQFELWGAHTDASYTDRVGVSYEPAGSVAFFIMPKNEWVHLALTFDGTNAVIYLNGVDEEGPKPFSIGPDVDAQVEIGYTSTRPSGIDRTFEGSLDEVRIYDYALTGAEIQFIMQGGEGYPYALGPNPADGTLYPDTWVNLSWRPGDFAVSHDVYFGDNFDDVNDGAEGTFQVNQSGTFIVVGFPGFAYPEGLVPGTTYYWRIDEVNDTEPNSPWKGNIWSFSVPPKTAYNPNPADGAESVALDVKLGWTAGFRAKLHTVYFGDNFDDVNNATGGLPQGAATYTPPGPLKLAKTYYWRVDEFDAINTYKGNVWSFTSQGAVGNPDPSNGAVDVKHTPILTWTPSVYAASHQVYFGADKDAVKNADTGSPEYKGTSPKGDESYESGKLLWDAIYYWRIDEVNNANADSPWKGNVWSFT
ncbi:MAG: LamG-like jellyroll fold domain-containing protein, partial [Sedimentisphaerales bacterium]